MPSKIPAAVAVAALALTALPAGAGAAGPVELRLTHPRSDPRFGELAVEARCPSACTLTLTELHTVSFKGTEQQPHGAGGSLGVTRRLPAGKLVTIRIGVPPRVQTDIAFGLPKGVSLLGHLAATVVTAGESYDVARQFTVVAPGAKPPFPPTATVDAFTVPVKPPAPPRGAKPPLYAMTLAGTQTSRWAYDRTSSTGACRTLDSGSGAQTIRFRSLRTQKVRQVWWRDGFRELQEVGRFQGGVSVPIRIDAERDSSERKGAEGDCGDYGGDEPGTPPACTRRGSVVSEIGAFFRKGDFTVGTSSFGWQRPSTVPDCPVESAEGLLDPLDILDTPAKRAENLARAGSPGKVIVVFSRRDVTRLEGGSVTTTVRITATFRKLG